ncbi:MAG: hypothetical protein ACLVLD_31375 [Hungatella sp.]|uniref:hypothetical protein n=1 Tax=Hungatella sp. TaxID=2613924 RepID=UPI0039916DD6
MNETNIVEVDRCINLGCIFCVGRQCITRPEIDCKTNECMSTNNQKYIIPERDIVKEIE